MRYHNRWAIGIVFLLYLLGCKEKEMPRTLLIPDEQMVEILVDLHIAEAAILSAKKTQKDSLGGIYFAQIFKMHDIQDSLFYKNLNIMSQDPILTQAIYEKVIEQIEKLDLTKEEERDKEEVPEEKTEKGTEKEIKNGTKKK